MSPSRIRALTTILKNLKFPVAPSSDRRDAPSFLRHFVNVNAYGWHSNRPFHEKAVAATRFLDEKTWLWSSMHHSQHWIVDLMNIIGKSADYDTKFITIFTESSSSYYNFIWFTKFSKELSAPWFRWIPAHSTINFIQYTTNSVKIISRSLTWRAYASGVGEGSHETKLCFWNSRSLR